MTAAEAVLAATDVVRERGWTIGQILAHQPPLMDLRTFAEAVGIAESTCYQEAAKGALPIEVIQIARTKYVRTVDAWRLLGLIDSPNGDGPGVAAPDPLAEPHPSTSAN